MLEIYLKNQKLQKKSTEVVVVVQDVQEKKNPPPKFWMPNMLYQQLRYVITGEKLCEQELCLSTQVLCISELLIPTTQRTFLEMFCCIVWAEVQPMQIIQYPVLFLIIYFVIASL